MDKVKELALKLKALADRGEGGEKQNAETMLADLLKKHGISIEELDGEEKSEEIIKINPFLTQFSIQIICSIVGDVPLYKVANKSGKYYNNKLSVDCTKRELIEIISSLDFYTKAYKRELKFFEIAFLAKNGIRIKNYKDSNNYQPSEADKAKVLSMLNGIDKHHFYKQISE